MSRSLDKGESEEPTKGSDQADSPGGVEDEQQSARRIQGYREGIRARAERRKGLFEQDALGRTPLFYAAEKGLEEQVSEMIFSLRGTGLFPPRLALIAMEDHEGLTAADVAEAAGHEEIARLLWSEQGRMEFFE
jgi:ankyrin repeat protein